jgi:ADP-ribose pyrophosphatase YjhB (NUDIX family)
MNDSNNKDAIWRPDVTVATVVPRGDRFLLVEETVHGRLVLNQPAGHLEPRESLLTAACRETLEETAWNVELQALIGIYQWHNADHSRHFVRFTFSARAVDEVIGRALDQGIVRALWMTRDEVAQSAERLRSPMVLQSLDDYLAGQRLPLSAIRSFLPASAA